MNRKYFLILLLTLFAACRQSNEKKSVIDVEGEWVYIDDRDIYYKDYQGIRFKLGEYFTINRSGATLVGKYELTNDSIIIHDDGKQTAYYVAKYTNDSLILSNERGISAYYNRKTEYNPNLALNELTIQAGPCFGKCPQFTLSINSDSVLFSPGQDCIEQKRIAVQSDPAIWKKLDSMFRWSQIDRIDTTGRFSIVDDWAIDLKVSYNTNESLKIRGSYDGLPYRLKPVIHGATEVAKQKGWIK